MKNFEIKRLKFDFWGAILDKAKIEREIIGYLVTEVGKIDKISVDSLKGGLPHIFNVVTDVRGFVDSLLKKYSWLGIAWTSSERDYLERVPGLHWYTSSKMFQERLVTSHYEVLSSLLASVTESVLAEEKFDRLMVDAGSTTFSCLDNDESLTKRAKELKTNNVFVAQKASVTNADLSVLLVGGVWEVSTGAMVNCGLDFPGGMDALLKARGRRPTVSLLSWHGVTIETPDVCLWTKSDLETPMKRACFEWTTDFVFIVLDWKKLGFKPQESNAERYKLSQLQELQNLNGTEDSLANPCRDFSKREIYFISDGPTQNVAGESVESSLITEAKRVADVLASDQFREKRIFFVSPALNSSPHQHISFTD